MLMRLYLVEYVATTQAPCHYWAENEQDAINEHRKQTGTDAELVASAVWANNNDKAHRGYVVDNK